MYGVLGFDPSLTSSGFAYNSARGYVTGRIQTKHLRGCERLAFIRDYVLRILDAAKPTLIVYEGYAMNVSRGMGKPYDTGELGGVLKLLAWDRGIDVLLVPPASLKVFVCGNGRADKYEVISAIARVWKYHIPRDDEADAFVLLKIGEAYLSPRHPRVAAQRAALRASALLKNLQSVAVSY